MTEPLYINEGNGGNFKSLVIDRSAATPVLVDFWADWCAPCKSLMPLLARLADEYEGRFYLVKVNTDANQELAAQLGIRSLPTVKLFKNGTVVDEFMGALPEAAVREFLDRHTQPAPDSGSEVAQRALESGDREGAIATLEKLIDQQPESDLPRLKLATLQADGGDLQAAQKTAEGLSSKGREDPLYSGLQMRVDFSELAPDESELDTLLARIEANPSDCEARYRVGTYRVACGELGAAMAEFMEIVRCDRGYNEDGGRKALLKCFQILGNHGELVGRYRRELATLLN